MKLSEAIEALKSNESRYAREIETGLYASGNPLPAKMIEKRRESLTRVQNFLRIAEGWAKNPPRGDFFTNEERELIANYELDLSFCAVVR